MELDAISRSGLRLQISMGRLGGKAHYLVSCPAMRVGGADEVATAAVFLASDESRFITGAALPVDGGKAAGAMPADRYRLDFPIRR